MVVVARIPWDNLIADVGTGVWSCQFGSSIIFGETTERWDLFTDNDDDVDVTLWLGEEITWEGTITTYADTDERYIIKEITRRAVNDTIIVQSSCSKSAMDDNSGGLPAI